MTTSVGVVGMGMVDVGIVGVAAFAVAGGLAGYGARLLVRRLRRGARIGAGWCEVAVAGLWGVTGAGWVLETRAGPWVPVLLGVGWLGVAAGAVDVVHHRLPDALTLPAIPVALLLLAPVGPGALLSGLAGAAVATAVYGGVHLAAPASLGAGDVKLAGSLGAVLAAASWPALVLAAVLAAGLTAVVAGVAVAVTAVGSRSGRAVGTEAGCGRRAPPGGGSGTGPVAGRRQAAVPHGPSMLAAAWLVLTALAAAGAPAGPGVG